jgi:hypothetical protein
LISLEIHGSKISFYRNVFLSFYRNIVSRVNKALTSSFCADILLPKILQGQTLST